MQDKYSEYIKKTKESLEKALGHLDYSYKKVQTLSENPADLDDESLEVWESFCARFARVVDLFLMRYIKVLVKKEDPAFEGTLRDYLNNAEKIRLIDDAKKWLELRELRNIAAHEYTDKDLKLFLQQIREKAPVLLNLHTILNRA